MHRRTHSCCSQCEKTGVRRRRPAAARAVLASVSRISGGAIAALARAFQRWGVPGGVRYGPAASVSGIGASRLCVMSISVNRPQRRDPKGVQSALAGHVAVDREKPVFLRPRGMPPTLPRVGEGIGVGGREETNRHVIPSPRRLLPPTLPTRGREPTEQAGAYEIVEESLPRSTLPGSQKPASVLPPPVGANQQDRAAGLRFRQKLQRRARGVQPRLANQRVKVGER